MTQLLVSVRNAEEAIAAVAGGADIIDVKEPNLGSLGCAAPDVIVSIAQAISRCEPGKPPLSLALGELKEWQRRDLTSLQSAIQHAAPKFLKLGLAETCTLQGAHKVSSTVSWIAEWQQVRATIPGTHDWVAVAYADDAQAHSPPVELVLEAAIKGGGRVLLIDTYNKNGKSLFDQMSLNSLLDIRRKTREQGLKLALAGSVGTSDLPQLLLIQPDIIAVRGAVCAHRDRTADVCRELVRDFRAAIQRGQRSDASV